MTIGLGRTLVRCRLGNCSDWSGVRQLGVVHYLVLEGGELLNDLLALGLLLSTFGLGCGLGDVLNSLGLECRVRIRGQLSRWRKIKGPILRTRMVGHRIRTESLAKDLGSEVMDWAETTEDD